MDLGNADGKKDNPAGLPNDNQILKFTKDGKFVMAIGRVARRAATQRRFCAALRPPRLSQD